MIYTTVEPQPAPRERKTGNRNLVADKKKIRRALFKTTPEGLTPRKIDFDESAAEHVDSMNLFTSAQGLTIDELQLNTVVTLCGLIIAFLALVFSDTKHNGMKQGISWISAFCMLYALYRVAIHHREYYTDKSFNVFLGVALVIILAGPILYNRDAHTRTDA